MTSDDGGEEADVSETAERIPDPRPRPTPLWALLSTWLLGLEAWLRSHGGKPLRYAIRGLWVAVSAIAAVLLVGPVLNPPLTLDDIMESASGATDTWIAREFDADYTLSRDPDGRLQAEVVETITAFFPPEVDESGIQRVLATQYEGHDLAPREIEVEIDGVAAQASTRASADRLTLTLDTGERLNGDHEFVIRYHLQDLAYPTTDDVTDAEVDLLEWSVFGPSWPQGFAALEVSVTLPDELDERLVRQPYGGVAWTLVSGTDWLDPAEDSPPGQQTYSFSVDQNMPPYAQSWFRMVFTESTFAMPPPTPLFLFQTFGPLIPLAILLLTLPFSLAARSVAWSDARGRPWYVAQYRGPKGVSVAQAVQIMRRARTRELALTLDALPRRGTSRRDALIVVGRTARRTGRIGDLLRARTAYLLDPSRRAQIADGFRRVPRGFVRDWFLAAPLALTLVQFAIIRQLSHQETLAVIWWPAVFVLVSLAVSAIVLWIALSARPLTRKGALVRQHLLGVDAYARQTSMLERTTLDEPALPYAVVTADPRPAGWRLAALVEEELGDRAALRGWRTPDFLSWPRLLVRAAAVLIVAGAIGTVTLVPHPYERVSNSDRYRFDSPGTLYTQVDNADVAAHVSADGDRPRIDVVSRFGVVFDEDSARVPQFALPLLREVEGQDLGLVVEDVRVDDESVGFRLTSARDITTVTTTLSDVRQGPADVRVQYRYDSPAVAGEGSPVSGAEGAAVDRIRLPALVDGWERGWTYPSAPNPVTLEIRIDDAVADKALSSGWLREDPRTADHVREWKDSSYPFGTAEAELGAPAHIPPEDHGVLIETREGAPGGTIHRLEIGEGEYGYPTRSTYTDLGVLLEFPQGTWAGTDPAARDALAFSRALPVILTASAGAVALLAAVGGVVSARLRQTRRTPPGLLRDAVWWLGTAGAAGASIVFVWATIDMPSDWPEFAPMAWAVSIALAAAITCWVAIRPIQR